jgi:hypothetical protein
MLYLGFINLHRFQTPIQNFDFGPFKFETANIQKQLLGIAYVHVEPTPLYQSSTSNIGK